MATPAAVLWDLDGTLVDTEPYWVQEEHRLVREFGGEWTAEHGLQLVGRALPDAADYIREHGGVDLTREEIIERLVAGVVTHVSREVPWRPGGRELLAALRSEGVPCGLVTMSYAPLVTPVLAALPRGTFDVVVTGDVVTRGKPHPEPYLHAARLLGVEPGDCVAVEDSEPGATSAEAAGCLVLVVENQVSVAAGRRRFFRPSLVGLRPSDLVGLAA